MSSNTRLKAPKDMTGMKFGRITVVCKDAETPIRKDKSSRWMCRCECGTVKSISRGQLLAGETNSCGCLRKEKLTKKYPRSGRLYQCWCDMKNRCSNPHVEDYDHYGGKGITVCPEWENDYAAFYEWAMANGYKSNLTLDRMDSDGNYCPENCRWTTPAVQTNNRVVTRYLDINGVTKPRSEWAKELGISYRKMRYLDDKNKLVEFLKETGMGEVEVKGHGGYAR